MVEEIVHELARARYFTKGDAYKAFLHVHLSKKSRELTIFGTTTHGRLRYKRMPLGMKMSQDVFQIQMDHILEQCPGVVPHLSHHTEPLRQLLKKEITFYWDDQLTQSFQEIKTLLKRATSKPLGYYDRRKEVIVQVDASLRGLGTCLIQDGKPIAFASKALTRAES